MINTRKPTVPTGAPRPSTPPSGPKVNQGPRVTPSKPSTPPKH